MARKKKSQERERNQQRRQEIKDADTLLEMFRKAHALPPRNLSVPGLIQRIEECELEVPFSDETIEAIANELAWYQDMANVRPDWRKDSKDAQDELEALAYAARGMLDQFAAIRGTLNMYILPFPVTFSELMEKRFGPTVPRNPHNRLDFQSFTDLQEMLDVLIQACNEPPGLPGMPVFQKTGRVGNEAMLRKLVHDLKGLIKPYVKYDRDEAYAQDIKNLLALIDVEVTRKRIRNLLSQSS